MKNHLIPILLLLIASISCKCVNKNNSSIPTTSKMEGIWTLKYITGQQLSFIDLYPNNKPQLSIDVINNKVQGNTGCNSFNGKVNIDVAKINFQGDMAMNKMRCLNEKGENAFLVSLKEIDSWSITNDSILNLSKGKILLLKFIKYEKKN